jgi:hypothetical protein
VGAGRRVAQLAGVDRSRAEAGAHVVRRGRRTSSPEQLGHVARSASVHAGQNVHSKLQMNASPSGWSGAPQRSHTGRSSRLTPQ